MEITKIYTEIYQIDRPLKFWEEDFNNHMFTIDYSDFSQIYIGIEKNNRNIIFQLSIKPKIIIEVDTQYLYKEVVNTLELISYPQRKEGEKTYTTRFVTYVINSFNDGDIGFHITTGNIIIRSKNFPENTYKLLKIDVLIEEVEKRVIEYQL